MLTYQEQQYPYPLLDKDFYLQLLCLEEEISKSDFNKEILGDLIQMYARLVEQYDGIKDPIKLYFLEKIQITVTKQEHQRVQNNDYKKTPKQNFQSNFFQSQKSEDGLQEKKKQVYNIEKKRQERAQRLKIIELQDKLNDNVIDNVSLLCDEFDKLEENKQNLLYENLFGQENSIKEKLRQRKEKKDEKKQRFQRTSQNSQYTSLSKTQDIKPKLIILIDDEIEDEVNKTTKKREKSVNQQENLYYIDHQGVQKPPEHIKKNRFK